MAERNYGFTPDQLARINARRAARGAKQLQDVRMGEAEFRESYSPLYSKEYARRQSMASEESPRRRFPETDEEETQVAGAKATETPRLAGYAGGAFCMQGPATPSLDEMKKRNEELEAQRNLKKINQGMTAASQMRMMA